MIKIFNYFLEIRDKSIVDKVFQVFFKKKEVCASHL